MLSRVTFPSLVSSNQSLVWVNNPKLYYLGMQNALNLIVQDAEAWYVRDIIMGRIHVPDRDALRADAKERMARDDAENRSLADRIRLHINYTAELLAHTDCPRFNLELREAAFDQWK